MFFNGGVCALLKVIEPKVTAIAQLEFPEIIFQYFQYN